MKAFIRKNPVLAYLCVAFGFSWSWWSILLVTTPPAVLQKGPPPLFFVFAALGGIGPSLAGILITAFIDGVTGVGTMFARVKPLKGGIHWYAASLFISPTAAFATLVTESILGKETASRKEELDTLPLSVIFPIFAALGEEFGWRGFLLPRVQLHYSALNSSILVGLTWGLWHIPTQVIAWRQDGLIAIASNVFVSHVVGITAQSVVMTWIYNNTKQNMLPMIMMHYSITFTAMFMFPLSVPAFGIIQHWLIYDAFYWLVAAIIIARSGPEYFIRGQDKKRRA